MDRAVSTESTLKRKGSLPLKVSLTLEPKQSWFSAIHWPSVFCETRLSRILASPRGWVPIHSWKNRKFGGKGKNLAPPVCLPQSQLPCAPHRAAESRDGAPRTGYKGLCLQGHKGRQQTPEHQESGDPGSRPGSASSHLGRLGLLISCLWVSVSASVQ